MVQAIDFRKLTLAAGAGLALLAIPLALAPQASGASEPVVEIPAPTNDLVETGNTATAIFAGGCFWGVQGVYQHVKGVINAVSGYAGGAAETASYYVVGSGTTGHAETVEITYDPSVVSYGKLLQIYFSVGHNPTQLNYQGPDHGTQYRSTIFYANDEQKAVAEAYIAELDAGGYFPAPIVTTLEPLEAFYPAEQYHQDFMTLNPNYPYIVYNDLPKKFALERLFPNEYRDEPALVGQLAAN